MRPCRRRSEYPTVAPLYQPCLPKYYFSTSRARGPCDRRPPWPPSRCSRAGCWGLASRLPPACWYLPEERRGYGACLATQAIGASHRQLSRGAAEWRVALWPCGPVAVWACVAFWACSGTDPEQHRLHGHRWHPSLVQAGCRQGEWYGVAMQMLRTRCAHAVHMLCTRLVREHLGADAPSYGHVPRAEGEAGADDAHVRRLGGEGGGEGDAQHDALAGHSLQVGREAGALLEVEELRLPRVRVGVVGHGYLEALLRRARPLQRL
eukprot:scaffold14290_cov63-Phaeocystis_antarctica.AAC.2